jgi:hypothetical protein
MTSERGQRVELLQGSLDSIVRRSASNREAKYYCLTRSGLRGLEEETQRWNRLAGLGGKLLTNEA